VNHQRKDIQGLRALAVILVIANHVLGWPSGGFVGVDVFFVVSGFLITGLLLREHETRGRISLTSFYKRRVRRILPAALAVTLVTVIVGYTLLPRLRFESLAWDAFWATLFSSNWRSIFLGTDYMHVDAALSPLQHFWSLSIEEQYYFVWPVILIAALAYGATRPRRTAGVVITVIGLLSFGFALWETTTNPTVAYFSTVSRVWELAAGAFLALGASKAVAISVRARPLIAWAGLVSIAGSAIVMTDATPFPGPWAVVPVIGTLAVLAAGIGGESRGMWPLTNPLSGYVGNLSYSLYLWHFPVLVFASLFLDETPRRLALVAIVFTGLLAIASYHFIENPVRFSKGRSRIVRPVAAVAAISVLAVVIVTVTPQQSGSDTGIASGPTIERVDGGPASEELWAEIDSALEAESWPAELSPAYEDVQPEDKAAEWVVDGCLGNERGADEDSIANTTRCSYGNPEADKIAVVYGDSTAIGWVPGVRAALEPLGYRIDVLAFQQCPTVDTATVYSDGSSMEECETFRDWAVPHMEQMRPDIIVATNVPGTLGRLASGARGDDAAAEWQEAAEASMIRLSAATEQMVVLQAPPTRNYSNACSLKNSLPSDCYLGRSADYTAMFSADKAASAGLEARFIDTGSWFCATDGRCPAFVGDAPVIVDGAHLTNKRSRALGPVLAELLVAS
jgi:peptidoglycan/LPS O-acetylase OafA/YrhL